MKGRFEYFPLADRACTVYLPPQAGKEPMPLAVLLAGNFLEQRGETLMTQIEQAVEQGTCRPFIAVSFGPVSWNRNYSPWEAPALREGAEPFGGKAGDTLRFLETVLLPAMEQNYPVLQTRESRMLAGYSLGGLAALWSIYQSDAFGRVASCSGSLWFDGWVDFMENYHPKAPCKLYLSVGRKEEKTANLRMKPVGENTRRADWIYNQEPKILRHALREQSGGHFDKVEERLAEALIWLSRD